MSAVDETRADEIPAAIFRSDELQLANQRRFMHLYRSWAGRSKCLARRTRTHAEKWVFISLIKAFMWTRADSLFAISILIRDGNHASTCP